MKRLVFDIETDNLLDKLTKVWCMAIYDLDEEKMYTYNPDQLEEGYKHLKSADVLIGHNIIKFDVPALKKLNKVHLDCEFIDTTNLSRLVYPDIKKQYDFKRHGKNYSLPTYLYGAHSLKAWGYRLGELKEEPPKFDEYSEKMLHYCAQDVMVNVKLYKYFESKELSPESINLEMKFQELMFEAEDHGVFFDEKLAQSIWTEMTDRSQTLLKEMQEIFPVICIPKRVKGEIEVFTPSRGNKTRGYTKGCEFSKVIYQEFNPNSETQIVYRLKKNYGWEPEVFTEKGSPSLDDSVLDGIHYPVASLIQEYRMLGKRISLLNGWFKKLQKGKVHGWMITNGAITGRCTHKVIANIPRVDKPYGKQFRALWKAPEGYKLVGCDAKGLELRMLAHYLGKWDGGEYVQNVLGDPHTANQKAAGLPTRDDAKTFIYALLYGGGDGKIGSIIGKGPKAGGRLKQRFLNNIPALGRLLKYLEKRVRDKNPVNLIDMRMILIDKLNVALNYLLQGSGALLMKRAGVIFKELCIKEGYKWGEDVILVIHYHDEFQSYTKEAIAERVAELSNEAIIKAGEYYNLRCPMEGDPKIGNNWAETH